MQENNDYFEKYLEEFPCAPVLVLMRSIEAKNLPLRFLKYPVLDLCCGDGFFATAVGLKNIVGCDISQEAVNTAKKRGVYSELVVCDIKRCLLNRLLWAEASLGVRLDRRMANRKASGV